MKAEIPRCSIHQVFGSRVTAGALRPVKKVFARTGVQRVEFQVYSVSTALRLEGFRSAEERLRVRNGTGQTYSRCEQLSVLQLTTKRIQARKYQERNAEFRLAFVARSYMPTPKRTITWRGHRRRTKQIQATPPSFSTLRRHLRVLGTPLPDFLAPRPEHHNFPAGTIRRSRATACAWDPRRQGLAGAPQVAPSAALLPGDARGQPRRQGFSH